MSRWNRFEQMTDGNEFRWEPGNRRRNCEARVGVVEEGDSGKGLHVAQADFNGQRTLAGGRTKILRIEALADPIGFAETVESGGGEQDCVDLAFRELAKTRVNVAAKLDGLNVAPQGLQLRAAALATGADARAARQLGEARMLDGNEHVARVYSGRRCRKNEA
jgi:hypothetical protein